MEADGKKQLGFLVHSAVRETKEGIFFLEYNLQKGVGQPPGCGKLDTEEVQVSVILSSIQASRCRLA